MKKSMLYINILKKFRPVGGQKVRKILYPYRHLHVFGSCFAFSGTLYPVKGDRFP